MRNTLIATSTAAIVALGATAALAQQSQPSAAGSGSSGSGSTAAGSSSTGGSSTSGSAMSGMPMKVMSQDKVRSVMKEAGFSDVQIMDAAYLVQAKTKDGDQNLVLVNAPLMNQANNAAATGSTKPGSGSSGSSTSGSSGGANPAAPK